MRSGVDLEYEVGGEGCGEGQLWRGGAVERVSEEEKQRVCTVQESVKSLSNVNDKGVGSSEVGCLEIDGQGRVSPESNLEERRLPGNDSYTSPGRQERSTSESNIEGYER